MLSGAQRDVGVIAGLWRYPIKSLDGESRAELAIEERGAELDRLWALVGPEGAVASGKTTRRFRKVPGLLRHSSRMDGDAPTIKLIDGREARVGTTGAERLVREIAGPGWSIQREGSVSHFDAAPLHLITNATLATLSAAARAPLAVERFRPNVLLQTDAEGFPEEEWIGRILRLGEVELRVVDRVERCVMVNHARATLPARSDVLKTIGRVNGVCAGVYAQVLRPGTIRVGARAMLTDGAPARRTDDALAS
jgi:uncharacterized protein YcbX